MVRRLIDILVCALALLLLSPLFALAALGVLLSGPGPVFFRATRAGQHGRVFTMFKFRTMHVRQDGFRSAITARSDPRVSAAGRWLRRLKIDELPQLWNVFKGEMSLVGPRPEDPRIVARHYAPAHMETLGVLPGLASPGSIYSYTHGERLLADDDPERRYVERLLPLKLALDTVYVREASLLYDLRIVTRTMTTILSIIVGRRDFAEPPEMSKAKRLVVPARPATGAQRAACA